MRARGCTWVVGLCAAGLIVLAPRSSSACAPVSSHEAVRISREQAIVVWDPATKRERFVRRAQFQTTAPNFGFLVPTPTKPLLEEASDGAFAALDQVVEDARVDVVERRWETGCIASMFVMRKGAPIAASAVAHDVTVLGTQTVAGLDATILEATSAEALFSWLAAHGYVQRPQITAWLAPYIAARYKITAFKYSQAEGRPSAEVLSKAVMLTFDTERPFYPYREPSDTEPFDGRALRVFVIAPSRMDGFLGGGGGESPWDVERVFAMPLAGKDGKLGVELSPKLLPSGAWLTVMNDHAARREARDVFFVPSKDRDEKDGLRMPRASPAAP